MSYSVTIYIANIGTQTNNEDGTQGHSTVGHMWFSINNDSTGAKYCYGFHPAEDGHLHSDVGQVRTNDCATYPYRWFTTTFEISDEEYENLMRYCESTKNNHTFGPYYGIGNSCINYTMNVMNSIRYGDFCSYLSPIPMLNVSMLRIATYLYNLKLKREANETEAAQARTAEREAFPTRQQLETQPFGWVP